MLAFPISMRAATESYPHLAYVLIEPDRTHERRDKWRAEWVETWAVTCYRLAARVERVSMDSALLDLGICSDGEATAALRNLLWQLDALDLHARGGIGPSLSLAQLAALTAQPGELLALVTRAAAPAFLRDISVAVLTRLHPRGLVTLETTERLQRYGLRTLGHIARLDEPALRRQFGALGTFLAAVAAGRDERPLHPTPQPARLRFRLRFAHAAVAERVLALLPMLAGRIAERLHRQGRRSRELRLSVRWESGGIARARRTLRQYTNDPALLAREMTRLLASLLYVRAAEPRTGAIEELRCTVGDFAPTLPEQSTFWCTRAQRMAAAWSVADTLAQRHGRPLLLHPRLAASAAIFAEDRYQLAALETGQASSPVAITTTKRERVAARNRTPGAWQDVPHRLHWW